MCFFLKKCAKTSWYFDNFLYFCKRNSELTMQKTRDLLVDVARQLFAKRGFDDTTMNDIAEESGKGRRTLYTYFSSKEEIYLAVIENELKRLTERLEQITHMDASPEKKMVHLIFTHLEAVKDAVFRNGNLRAEFFRDIWKVEAVRKDFDRNEIIMIRRIMNEGNDKGDFDIKNVKLMAVITHYCIKGCEVPYIYGRIVVGSPEELFPYVRNLVHKALSSERKEFVYGGR